MGKHATNRSGLFAILTGLFFVGCSTPGEPLPPGANGRIVAVVDGDTVDVSMNGRIERVRLIGIDTPETKKPDTPVQCFGPEASARTKALLPEGTAVDVQRDSEARDPYGRLLGYIYRTADGRFINRDLIVEGFARPLSIAPNTTFAREFATLAREAQAANIGLWGSCPTEP